MSKEETISNFNGRLCDIANDSFALGVYISRFAYKATAIREAKDLKR